MHVACFAGNMNCVEFLYEKLGTSALVEKDHLEKTCLDNAINAGYKEIAKWLTSKLVDSIWKNIKDDNEQQTEKLLSSVEVDAFDFISPQMLHYCAEMGLHKILDVLFKFGASSFIETKSDNGETALEILVKSQREKAFLSEEHLSSLLFLLSKGARVSFSQEEGNTIEEKTGINRQMRAVLLDVPPIQINFSFGLIRSLTELDLSNSSIANIPQSISKLEKLQIVKLANNKLEALPSFLADMNLWEQTSYDWLEGNELNTIPVEIVSAFKKGGEGIVQMRNYLKQLEGSKEVWNSVKLVVVGKEAVGKTHLLKAMKYGAKPHENISTDGIEIDTNWKLKTDVGEVTIRTFDFGGQTVYYPTHQFFLTGRSIYIVAFNLSDSNYLTRINYWLATIDNIVEGFPRPSIILVGTHLDVVKKHPKVLQQIRLTLEKMQRSNKQIVGVTFVSPVKMEGIEELRNSLVQVAIYKKLVNKVVPKFYKDLDTIVSHYSTGTNVKEFISWNEYVKLSESYNVSESSLFSATKFLNDCGSLMWFGSASTEANQRGASLSDIVIFNLQWLANRFLFSYPFFPHFTKKKKDERHNLLQVQLDQGTSSCELTESDLE